MAIMPLLDLTTPSRRSVLTCKPALPGGKFLEAAAAACWRPTSDSKGSRRPALLTPSASAVGSAAGPSVGLADFFVGDFFADLAVALPAGGAAGFGCIVCANKTGALAATRIPRMR